MSVSLYEATIPTMIQILQAGQGWVEKAKECGISEEELADSRLIEDMLPFGYQIKSMIAHSVGAVEGVRKGLFSPDLDPWADKLEQMRLNLGAAENTLRALSKGEIDSFVGGETRFVFEKAKIDRPYASEDFLLSFSQPNFFFHATTAYAILRSKGVKLGKGDFLGQSRALPQ
ncbi:DUF1993 family protein [Aurantiacibacter aquimixticola]|uniref:DUF1993 domain-containing protein n=1 Tax=Aurantiacibacter aquimixticola TaxID=1958945 RepID=A0A419RQN1_9SPHN|nr:DUF1993 domain-containing protein [Aurantiacibacter aquimixticola]RJY08108.1 DUF1993 domain-containing protein [Aurantiacibacter aquimixticola]